MINDLLKQKEELEAQITAAREAERADALEQITALMKTFGINKVVVGKPANKVAPKFEDSATGKQWTGRGVAPKWYAEAQANGTLVDLRVTE